MTWYVEIRRYGGDNNDPGYRRMQAQSRHDAERIERGANINLNHENYYTISFEDATAEEKLAAIKARRRRLPHSECGND